MQQQQLLTITGRPLTVPATFRLPVVKYSEARELAERKGVSLSKLFEDWVSEKLEGEHGNGKK